MQFYAKTCESLAEGSECRCMPVDDDDMMDELIEEEAETALKEVAETLHEYYTLVLYSL